MKIELSCPPFLERLDQTMDLYRELARAAITYVLAERRSDDKAALVNRIAAEMVDLSGDGDRMIEAVRRKDAARGEMIAAGETASRAEEEWKRVAEKLVAALEASP